LLAQQQIIGFSVFSRVLDEATLLNIALHPDQQGNGYGRRLLEHGINHQIEAGAQRFILEVRVSNRLAISLYRSLGFETVGERKNYYPALDGRENAWVMCLEAGYKIATDPIAII
jgi:ribosomal-protein-alanine N-acetyltransferase